MKERHLKLAVAMGGIAAHGIREWQNKIASGAELNLQPEQVALLVRCATELERSTLGVDAEHSPTEIRILFGRHTYSDEVGGNGEAEPEAWTSLEDAEAHQFERLDDEQRKSWLRWRDAPKKLGALNAPESDDDGQVN